MPTLKIKDKNGNWVTVNVLKGVTDQTYNPESDNAQSGIAVAEALENCASVIKNTKSGNIVTMNDVSPAQHSLDIKLNATIEVLDYAKLTSTSSFFVGESVIRLTNSGEGFTNETLSELCPELKEGDIVTIKWQSPDDDYRYVALVGAAFISSSNDGIYYCRKYAVTEVSLNNQVEISGLTGTISNLSITIENTEIDFSSVKVSRYEKNLIPYPYDYTTTEWAGVTYADNGDGTITVSGTATGYSDYLFKKINIRPNTQYCYSGFENTKNIVGLLNLIDANGKTIATLTADPMYESQKKITFNSAEYPQVVSVQIGIKRKNNDVTSGTIYPQLEIGLNPTEYEPYKEPQTVTSNEDGIVTGLKSISPNMTLLTDTNGVIINTTYNVDTKTYIDRKFAELSQALLNL